MFKHLKLVFRKVAVIFAVAGFLVAPSLTIDPAQADTRTDRLLERYQPPGFGGNSPLELGVLVQASKDGWITQVYFYKYWGDDGGHSAHIWSDNGTLLGSQDFVSETTGWQVVTLDNPVQIVAGQIFTVSVYGANFYFAGGSFPTRTSGPLTILDSSYKYTDHPEFPQDSVHTNYAIDFSFTSDSDPANPEPDPGLRADVYSLDGGDLPNHTPDYVLCSSKTFTAWHSVDAIDHLFDSDYGGIVAGCAADQVMIHYSGYITWPKTQTVKLQALADDGFFMTLDGETVIDDWSLKGCSGSIVTHSFVANEPQKLDAWFYEWGGGACSRLGYIQDGDFTPIPKDAYTKNALYTSWGLPAVAPSKPRNVQATVSGLDINVSWDEPASDGGSDISGYTVTATSGGSSFSCQSSAISKSCTLPLLPAGRDYSITVVAHSNSGTLHSQDSDSITKSIGTGVLHPTLTAPRMDPLTFGQALSAGALLGGSSNTPGSFSYKFPNTQPSVGSSQVDVVFTPEDTTTYTTESLTIDVLVNKAPRSLVWSNQTDEDWDYGLSHNAQATASIGVGAISYSVLNSTSVCSVNANTGELSALRAGNCLVEATIESDGNYLAVSSQKTLSVLPVEPSSPTNLAVALDGTSATVSWTAPSSDGGTEISSYSVTLKNSDETKSCSAPASATSCKIEGLTQGVDYSVEVIALSNQEKLQALPGSVDLAVPTQVLEPIPDPEPTAEPYVDPRPFEPINPVVDDPAGVAQKTVAAITLVSAVAAAGAAVAGAAGAVGAAGGAASGGAKADSKSDSGEGKDRPVEQVGHLRHLSRGKIDDSALFGGSGRWGDLLKIWSLPIIVALDNPPKKIAQRLGKVLPLGAKIFSDGAYLRAMFGTFSALLPLTSIVIAIAGVIQANALLVLPPVAVVAGLVLIGTFDVLAGFLGTLTLAVGLAVTAGIHSAADVRFLFGVVALGIVPRVISGAFRVLRREVKPGLSYFWERLLDYVVAPMLAAWASLQIVEMLPIFAGIAIPVEELAKTLPVVVAAGMIIRVSLEEIAGRYFPDRISYVQVTDVPKAPLTQVLISTILRASTFAFVAIALIGVSWHLIVGAFIFVLPNILGLFQSKFPNSRKLYHLMPQGLVNLCVSLWLGQITLLVITGIFHQTPELAKLGFVLLPIPTLILSILKLFGRHGREGEPRFYEKPSMGWFYRFGTVIMLIITAELTHTINLINMF